MSCMLKVGRGRSSQEIDRPYRDLGLYDKSYNRWHVTGQKKPWAATMKKYKMAIHMLQDSALEDYEDVDLTDKRYDRKDICKVIDGSQVVAVKGKLSTSAV